MPDARTYLEMKYERPARTIEGEEDGVPMGLVADLRDQAWWTPRLSPRCDPDSDVGMAFMGPGEPSGEEACVRESNNRGGVTL